MPAAEVEEACDVSTQLCTACTPHAYTPPARPTDTPHRSRVCSREGRPQGGTDAGSRGDKAGESSGEEATGKDGKGGEGKGRGDDDEATHTQNSATYRSGRAGTSARTPRTQTQTQLTARSRGGASAAEGSKVAVCSRLRARTFKCACACARACDCACAYGRCACLFGGRASVASIFRASGQELTHIESGALAGLTEHADDWVRGTAATTASGVRRVSYACAGELGAVGVWKRA